MNDKRRYSLEVRERAIRMLREQGLVSGHLRAH